MSPITTIQPEDQQQRLQLLLIELSRISSALEKELADMGGWASAGARLECGRTAELLRTFGCPRDQRPPMEAHEEAVGYALLAMNRALALTLEGRGGNLVV